MRSRVKRSPGLAALPSLAPATSVDKIVSFSAEPEPLNFCSIAEPHTTSRLRRHPITKYLNTTLDAATHATRRVFLIGPSTTVIVCSIAQSIARARQLLTSRRAFIEPVAPLSRVSDSGLLPIHHSTMASELAPDAVVPNINGTDESLPAVGADSAVLNSEEADKPLTNG